MSKRFWTALALGLAAVAMVATGCSDSDTNSNPLTTGDNNDPDFQFVEQEVFDIAFDGIDVSLELSMLLIDSIPGAAPTRLHHGADAAFEGDLVITSYDYNYTNGWHVFQVTGYIAQAFPVDTFDLEGSNSIQILADGVPQVEPDETTDGFDYDADFDVWSRASSDSISGNHSVQVRMVEGLTFMMEINGTLLETVRFTHSDQSGSCDVNVQSSLAASGIQMDFESDGCPLEGSVTASMSYTFDCQGGRDNPWALAGSGVWTVTGRYDGVNESYTFTNGTNVWTTSEPCGDGPAASHLRW